MPLNQIHNFSLPISVVAQDPKDWNKILDGLNYFYGAIQLVLDYYSDMSADLWTDVVSGAEETTEYLPSHLDADMLELDTRIEDAIVSEDLGELSDAVADAIDEVGLLIEDDKNRRPHIS